MKDNWCTFKMYIILWQYLASAEGTGAIDDGGNNGRGSVTSQKVIHFCDNEICERGDCVKVRRGRSSCPDKKWQKIRMAKWHNHWHDTPVSSNLILHFVPHQVNPSMLFADTTQWNLAMPNHHLVSVDTRAPGPYATTWITNIPTTKSIRLIRYGIDK